MVWRKDLSPELKAKVKAAFLAIKDLNWSDQGKLNGFKDTSDQAYDVVRETAKLANIDLKKQK
jgi:phosphonate transport system substrate-binding protein